MNGWEIDEDLHVDGVAVARTWKNRPLVSHRSSSHCTTLEMAWQEAAERKLCLAVCF